MKPKDTVTFTDGSVVAKIPEDVTPLEAARFALFLTTYIFPSSSTPNPRDWLKDNGLERFIVNP
jgi:hypothetical protein